MIRRWIAVWALSALLVFAPTQSQAQVADVLWKCTRSLTVALACVIFDGGVKKAVEVGWDKIYDLAAGFIKELRPNDFRPTSLTVAEIEESGIEWSKLREFLISVYKSGQPVDAAQFRDNVHKSCNANWHPVCKDLGIARPREPTPDCSKITNQRDCDSMFCSWKGSVCARPGGVREMLKQ